MQKFVQSVASGGLDKMGVKCRPLVHTKPVIRRKDHLKLELNIEYV